MKTMDVGYIINHVLLNNIPSSQISANLAHDNRKKRVHYYNQTLLLTIMLPWIN